MSPEQQRRGHNKRAPRLTEQQYQVVCLMLRGLSNAEIGEVLNIAMGTLDTHKIHIRQKLNLDIEGKPTKVWLNERLWLKIAELYDQLGFECPEDPGSTVGGCIRNGVCDCKHSEVLPQEIVP